MFLAFIAIHIAGKYLICFNCAVCFVQLYNATGLCEWHRLSGDKFSMTYFMDDPVRNGSVGLIGRHEVCHAKFGFF